jgi:hypothetical protein
MEGDAPASRTEAVSAYAFPATNRTGKASKAAWPLFKDGTYPRLESSAFRRRGWLLRKARFDGEAWGVYLANRFFARGVPVCWKSYCDKEEPS